MKKPERPEDDDCCGGGCSPCVWDTYNRLLSDWLEQQGKNPLQSPDKDHTPSPEYR